MHAITQIRRVAFGSLGCLILAILSVGQLRAQVTIGDNLTMNLSGSLGYGYSGSFGNTENAGHSQNIVGNGSLTGYYYNPNFISFSARPYWDRNQSNGLTGSLTHDNGLDTQVNFFGGSYFPGSITYGKTFNGGNDYGIPGVGGILTHGSGQTLGISWNELIPGLPPLFANYSMGSSSFGALGSQSDNHNSNRNFNLGSNYQLFGFAVNGSFSHDNSSYDFADILAPGFSGASRSTSYSLGAQHPLPLRGSMGVAWGRSSFATDGNAGTNGTTNSISAASSFVPFNRLSISGQAQYTSNLTAAMTQNLLSQSTVTFLKVDNTSHSIGYGGAASFQIGHGWSATANINQTSTTFAGQDYSNTQYGASVNYRYAHNLWGLLHFSFGLVDMASKEGNGGVGMIANVGADHRFGRWDTAADFSYSQDVKTLYGIATSSHYSYGGSIRRKINRTTRWGGTFRASHSGLSQQVGTSSGTESFSTNFSWRRYTFAGSYAQSQGVSVLTTTGQLVPTSAAGLITGDLLLFNGRSMSASASTRLLHRFNVSGAYARSRSNINSSVSSTFSEGEIYSTHIDYKLRKMMIVGGYSRVHQQASAVKSGPYMVNSFFLSFSRWFNVF